MTDQMFAQVNRIELDLAVRLSQPGLEQLVQAVSARSPSSEARPAPEPGDGAAKKPDNRLLDISLRFQIDAETRDVTILILDRASQRVVRTIPPEEMANLDPGEILQLFA